MSIKDWDSDDWFLPLFLALVGIVIVVGLVYLGWSDWQENKVISECIRAGKTWKDGNCG